MGNDWDDPTNPNRLASLDNAAKAAGMKVEVKVIALARDKKGGMTLDELAEFVQEAQIRGIHGETPIRVQTGWSAQIQWLQVPR